ncbi:TolC family protein [Imbroritus primus]|uniref:TolC family protein n=1 Tax=Imbroritus primus TaxID=3058603 RepID=A0ACD3SU85_9BURK|nr:TolC family protein [Burkholderiaceae bacterium PBA]
MYRKTLILFLPTATLAWASVAHGAPAVAANTAGPHAVSAATLPAISPVPSPTAPPATRTAAPSITLAELFELAWARQPEARATAARRDAALATRDAAASWSADAPALSLQAKSDRPGANEGAREYEVGIGIPLWLPGERNRSARLAEAELKALDSSLLAARLRLAENVREAWWRYQRAQGDWQLAQVREANARQLAGDVARRVKAGDLARADQHQADGAAAQAEAAVAEAAAEQAAALHRLRALAGTAIPVPATSATLPEVLPEALPDTPLSATAPDGSGGAVAHPAVIALLDRAQAARDAAALARQQNRANPELTVAATRERDVTGASFKQSFTVGIRIPFGAGPRARAKQFTAQAEALDAEAQAELETGNVAQGIASAQAQLRAAQTRQQAAERRARLAREARGFFDKSFRLGETDLPTRLRIELEAIEAEQAFARARIDAAAAVSGLRQAMGLLPQ